MVSNETDHHPMVQQLKAYEHSTLQTRYNEQLVFSNTVNLFSASSLPSQPVCFWSFLDNRTLGAHS